MLKAETAMANGGKPKREREALKPDFPFCPRKRLRLTRLNILQLFTHKL
jgi:hypothetical protein